MGESGACATALMSGVKANFETIGLSGLAKHNNCTSTFVEGGRVSSIAEWAQQQGKWNVQSKGWELRKCQTLLEKNSLDLSYNCINISFSIFSCTPPAQPTANGAVYLAEKKKTGQNTAQCALT